MQMICFVAKSLLNLFSAFYVVANVFIGNQLVLDSVTDISAIIGDQYIEVLHFLVHV